MLQFGSFKIHFMNIQKFQKIQYTFRNFKIPLLKNIINIVEFHVTFLK